MKFNFLFFLLLTSTLSFSQTFFETAEDDGIITFRANDKKNLSQIKLNFSSTALTYGYYYLSGKAIDPLKFIFNTEVKLKPNDDGVAVLAKSGQFQPGIQVNTALGVRFNDAIFKNNFSVLDIYFKPEFTLTANDVFDSTRKGSGLDPLYTSKKGVLSGNLLVNYALSIGRTNVFLGTQFGWKATSNIEDLNKGTIQIMQPYSGGLTNQYLISDSKEVNIGKVEDLTKKPFKIDLIFDPGMKLTKNKVDADKTNMKIGTFGYFRSDFQTKNKYRTGFGLCLLNQQNPSQIFGTIGYELPAFGKAVDKEERKKDKGLIFLSVGYSIL